MKILIVEDEEKLRKSLAEGLRLKGYAIDVAGDGESADEKPFKLVPRCGVGRSAVPAGKENPAGIVSWRTRRIARRKRDVSDLPYAAPPLSCAAFFVKVLERFCRDG